MKKLCWCCNGKGFYMKPDCKWCDAGDEHRQCERGEPKRKECKACNATAAPKSQPNDSTTVEEST